MGKAYAFAYGLVCYTISFATILYSIGFVGGIFVPKAIDDGPQQSLGMSLTVDVLLLSLFAFQHSVMARPAFKAGWTKIIPMPIERSTYVLLSSSALILLFWQWRPISNPVLWHMTQHWLVVAVWVLYAIGWSLALSSTFLISHFELFGLKQVWANLVTREASAPRFRTPLFYNAVRHPLYVGFIIAFWSTPRMSPGHCLFALGSTAYILVAIQFEERDLMTVFGDRYLQYRRTVPMIVPRWPRKIDKRPQTSQRRA